MISPILWWRTRGLRSPDWVVRRRCVVRLGQWGDGRAVPHLVRALADAERCVREAAADALQAIGDRRAVAGLIGALSDLGEEGARRLATIDPAWKESSAYEAALPGLLARLRDRRAPETAVLAAALAAAEEPRAVPPILEALDDPEVPLTLKLVAVRVAGQAGRGDLRPKLVALLDDPALADAAAEALAAIHDAAAVEPLLDWLARQPAPGERGLQAVVQALDALEPTWRNVQAGARVLGRFVERLEHPQAADRRRAIEACARLGVPSLADRMVPLLFDPDPVVRLTAQDAMGPELSNAGLLRLADGFARTPATAPLEVLRTVQDRLAGLLPTAVGHRPALAVALGHLGRAEAIPALVEVVRDADSTFWDEAVLALGRFGGAEALTALAAALPARPYSQSLIYSLAAAGGPSARPLLTTAAAQPLADAGAIGLALRILPEEPAALDAHDRGILCCLADSRRLHGLGGRESITFMRGPDVPFFRELATRFPSAEVVRVVAFDLGCRSSVELARMREYEDVLALAARGVAEAAVDRGLSLCSNWPAVGQAVRQRLAPAGVVPAGG